ncbi:ABC transporter ATP-binding protein [Sporosarcina sp. ACRSM]|uniref:ABC transporter ATP-binding protein n=1 Tax=Sporosarcina sp. ACRSM TaxID=2918216 RepID=UPI001EF51751|nr:ABC transporter ATP-binding protein [Sporosarcina sp. ACRSM]MCG7335063.1 ABC transporter ATP-binding protein [Sporosarcina sp. ACRSM]
MIKVERLAGGYGKKPIVQDIDLEIEKGEFFALLGPNGSGKTTLFKLITGQLPILSGDIFITGKAVSKLTKLEKARKVAVLSQEVQMTFDYTVEEIVSLGRYPHQKGLFKILSSYDRQVIDSVMKITNVERYRKTNFRLLSGGEKQRVLLAKALAQEPEILLLDEPTNHLDIKHTFHMLDLLKEWQQTKGLTIFAILHDLNVASLYADRVALLHEGSFLEVGDVNTLRKEQQLKQVYEVEVHAQAHPFVPKPQLHLTPTHAYEPEEAPLAERFQVERVEEIAHLRFYQPLRSLSNATVGEGVQWLQHFCLLKGRVHSKQSLLDGLEEYGIPPEQAAAIGFNGNLQHVVISERPFLDSQLLVVAAIEASDNVDAIHLMLFINGQLSDKALFDGYMAATEAKVKACQRFQLGAVQSAKDVLLIAGTQVESQLYDLEPIIFREGIEQAVIAVLKEAFEKIGGSVDD